MGKTRRGEWVLRVGARAATGERSRIVSVKVPETKSDVYVFFEVDDIKYSIHDPAESIERPPWQLNLTDKHFLGEKAPLRDRDKRLISAVGPAEPRRGPHPGWGPIGAIPDYMYAALQILVPASELVDRSHWKEPSSRVDWIEPLTESEVAFFLLLYAPSAASGPSLFHAPKGLKEIGRRTLRNGRQLIVCGGVAAPIPAFWEVLEAKRAQGERLIFDGIAAGETAQLDIGLNEFDGYFPLGGQPCETMVEMNLLSFYDLAGPTA